MNNLLYPPYLPQQATTNHLPLLICALLSLFGQQSQANEDIIQHGPGSYTTKRPETCKEIPSETYRVPSLNGATPTNQWWSSLCWEPHSQNLFAHPLTLKCLPEGLTVSYPASEIAGKSGNILGAGMPEKGDLLISHSGITASPSTLVGKHSDWFITTEFRQKTSILQTSFGHGSPFVFCIHHGGKPQIHFRQKPVIWSGSPSSNTLGLTIGNHHYGLFGAINSSWSGTDSLTFTNETSEKYSSIALLPDNTSGTLELFASYAHNHITNTSVIYTNSDGAQKNTYLFETHKYEGSRNGTLFALYPHQWKYSKSPLTKYRYQSPRGVMKLASGSKFETVVPIQGLLPMLPKEGIPDQKRMLAYLKKEAAIPPPEFKDTYWEGKHLGKLATLSGIAEVLEETQLQQTFLSQLKSRLENWFVASPNENSPLFYYNTDWGTLIGNKPSYGSDFQLNDHHFHYGYFIRAAAEIARNDAVWAKRWAPMVELLIRDIASTDRHDPLFPYIRCFDMYAGHSWASGNALFADGNNQESSSESLNAWYALILWGEATGNTALRDTGIFLFNTERTAVEEYWFDVSETNFPKDFPHVALGMVWGGKGAFATWFSGEIDCIHGINWLPFTPASIYMGRFPEYVAKNHARIIKTRKGGTDYQTGWGDLVVMFNALSSPKAMSAYFDQHPDGKLEPGNTHAFMYHWLNTLDQLGLNDSSVTSSHPFTNVFRKGEQKSYAAYNFSTTSQEISFSDGTKLLAKPKSLTVKVKNHPPKQ